MGLVSYTVFSLVAASGYVCRSWPLSNCFDRKEHRALGSPATRVVVPVDS